MAFKKIIPCLDTRDGRVVKGTKFEDIKDIDDPVELAKFYNNEGADELVLYDITASNEKRNIMLDLVKRVSKVVTIPFTVGGGVKTVEDFGDVLDAGADKVSINSSAVKTPELIKQASEKFGKETVVLAIDAKKISDDKWNVFVDGGRTDTGLDAIEWSKRGEELGAGELVMNNMNTDGVKDGYDLELMKKIAEVVDIPTVASGGAGKKEHFYEALTEGNAMGALAASVFHFREIKISELKDYLANKGIEVKRS